MLSFMGQMTFSSVPTLQKLTILHLYKKLNQFYIWKSKGVNNKENSMSNCNYEIVP